MAEKSGQEEAAHGRQLVCTEWREAEALVTHDSVRDDHGRKHHLASQNVTSLATRSLIEALIKETSALLRAHRLSVGGVQRYVVFLHCL